MATNSMFKCTISKNSEIIEDGRILSTETMRAEHNVDAEVLTSSTT